MELNVPGGAHRELVRLAGMQRINAAIQDKADRYSVLLHVTDRQVAESWLLG